MDQANMMIDNQVNRALLQKKMIVEANEKFALKTAKKEKKL